MRACRCWPLVVVSLIGPAAAGAQVPYERLRAAGTEPGAWLTYSGTYEGHRFSPLGEITPANVARLRPAWVYQAQEAGPPLQATPLVADGVMYVTETRSRVAALDLRTGRTLWRFEPEIPKTVRVIGYGPTNRGVALLDDRVYVGTLDAHLVALDAVSGAVRWDVEVADNALGYGITSAPLAIDGKIIIGVSGGEAGIRGFLDAYDARTGKRVWRFNTVPGPGEPGHDTWGGESWKTGGAPTWLTGSFDPSLNLLYFGVGNPAPDWNGDDRPGDNLYSSSLVALDAATGALRWHFQFTPHDTHDWDANQIPVLVDATVEGRPRKLVITANRNGFYYVLDRTTGEYLRGTAYARQTWASGLDARGRPLVIPGTEPSETGTVVWPSLQGATNWFSPAFDARRQLLFVPVREMGSKYFKAKADLRTGQAVHGRRRGRGGGRPGVWRCPRAGRVDRRATVGAPSPLAAVGRCDGDRWWAGLRQHQRRQRLRARRGHRTAAVGFSDGRQLHVQPDLVPDRWAATHRNRVRPGCVRVRPALKEDAWQTALGNKGVAIS